MRNIVLMGFMGAGKTTIGRKLAEALSCEFIDTDERIEKDQGRKISDIFAEDGEQAFCFSALCCGRTPRGDGCL